MKLRALLFLLSAAAAHAGPRSSASYNILTDGIDDGGKRTTSAAYTNDASAGGIAGLSTVAAPAETVKSGYIGQLYDVTGLTLTAAPLTINEGGTLQLAAWQLLDDATFLAVPASSVAWSVASGPLTSINASGLATAGIVYQNTAATAQGIYAGNTSVPLALTVLDSIPDNFGTYAGDSVGDDWQVQYFGLPPNPIAGPLFDPDGDGQNNLFEFRTGYVPTNAGSRFVTRGLDVSGGNFQLELSRVQPGTRYVFQRTSDFVTWTDILTLDPATVSAPFTQPLPAAGTKSFYRVEITKP